MFKSVSLVIAALACCLLLAACQSPSPNAGGRAQQESNDPIPTGDPGVPTHGM